MPKLVDTSFVGDDFEHFDHHLCVSPSVASLVDDEKVREAARKSATDAA
jgi:hypothetical protein